MTNNKDARILRFSKQDRFQHWLLVFSFTLLALTGLVQKYSGAELSRLLITLMGGIEFVRVIHRFAAIVLMLETVYHLGVISYAIFVKRAISSMLPTLQDVKDAWLSLQVSLGMRKEKPEFGRYSFEEKFEYWAVVWGMGIMILTGFMLWNPIATTKILPGEFIPAAKSAHGNEALLAVLAIIIWHFYNVLVRHFNKSMFTGYLSKKEMREFHPIELDEIEKRSSGPRGLASEANRRRRLFLPIYGVISLILVAGIYLFVTFEESALAVVDPDEQSVIVVPTATPLSNNQVQEGAIVLAEGIQPIDLMWPASAHTNRDAAAFRYWDAQLQVPAECSTCHSSQGLPDFLVNGIDIAHPVSNGLTCQSCHDDTSAYSIHQIDSLSLPSGVLISSDSSTIMLCATCHSGLSAANALGDFSGQDDQDAIIELISFPDLHSASVGPSFFGGQATAAFQYPDHTYHGAFKHVEEFDSCAECHTPHELEISAPACANCHTGIEASLEITAIRFTRVDYDGDGNNEEGISHEIDGLEAYLLESIQAYSANQLGMGIVYDSQHYPHYFIDLNENAIADVNELDPSNAFDVWNARLIKAAFNHHYSAIDSGGFSHNPKYMLQILFDSLEDIGADVSRLARP